MIDARDIERSNGENSASEVEELVTLIGVERSHKIIDRGAPHTHEVLHHELVQRLRRVRHIHLSFPISEVRLKTISK